MPQSLRPQSVKLRQIARQRGAQDIGAMHVIDYWLHLATTDRLVSPNTRLVLPRIGRYLDGEEDREGTYR